ncbi:MAG: ankyrin repeat domain-containing protein [Terracidiphilus sp.]
MKTFQSHRLHMNLSHRFAALLLGLAALAVSPSAFCAPIHDAARAGDLAKVKALVKADPSLVSSKDDQYGQTPLHIAAFNDHKDVAEFLLASKADVNAKAKNGSTPLHLAAAKGNKDIVELLLANKADINAVDNEGWSPLHSAVIWDHKDVQDLLVAKGGTDLPAAKKPSAAANAAPAEKGPPKETGKDGQFTAYDDGTVLDTKTKLMWMARDNGSPMSWPDAKKYAQDYRGAGYTDWRLPTLAEISALFDKAKTRRSFCSAAVDEMGAAADETHVTDLIRLTCTRLWTSEERKDKPGWATVFDMHTGSDAGRPGTKEFVDTASRVLEVRVVK